MGWREVEAADRARNEQEASERRNTTPRPDTWAAAEKKDRDRNTEKEREQ